MSLSHTFFLCTSLGPECRVTAPPSCLSSADRRRWLARSRAGVSSSCSSRFDKHVNLYLQERGIPRRGGGGGKGAHLARGLGDAKPGNLW
ncbi:hypothetical protein GQ53DRAFT_433349 [Thozetella sp. PMI_491]|nr:hypothetical protein GQ53DRAFT_433349 [Thozetella sp. PMI_491]